MIPKDKVCIARELRKVFAFCVQGDEQTIKSLFEMLKTASSVVSRSVVL